MPQDNLDEAQQRVDGSTTVGPQEAIALALIDIGRTLREIHDEMRTWDTYGFPRHRGQ